MKSVKFGVQPVDNRQMTEALRQLKTNIKFSGDDIKKIVFTSSAPDEGKSTIVLQLARSMTDSGNSVIIVDCDMRKSTFVSKYKVRVEGSNKSQIHGLSHYLAGQAKIDDVIYTSNIEGMSMVFAGPTVPNPTELLGNHYFEELLDYCSQHYDYVLVDCPPMGAAIDAAVVAVKCDGAIYVIAQDQVPTKVIQDGKRQLEASGVRLLGAVLNKVKVKSGGYYGKYYGGYYGKYYGSYYGYGDEDKK